MQICRNSFAQFCNAICGGISVMAITQGFDGSLDNMRRGWEIGLADAQIYDIHPLRGQNTGTCQNCKGIFFANSGEFINGFHGRGSLLVDMQKKFYASGGDIYPKLNNTVSKLRDHLRDQTQPR